jgi:hypothetical protein
MRVRDPFQQAGSMQGRMLALVGAIGAILAIESCKDATGVRAQFENLDSPDVNLYAMNGTPQTLPAAILLQASATVPISSDFNFDIAFDLNDTGAVVIYPVRLVASEFVRTHTVGLDTVDAAFDDVLSISGVKFQYDSAMIVRIGQTVVVDAIAPNCSAFSLLGQNIRAKLKVDSVLTAKRQIWLHLFVDPNCGFRSLAPGTPRQ